MIFCTGFLAVVIGILLGMLVSPSKRGGPRWFAFVVFPVLCGTIAMCVSVGILLWRVMP